MLVPRRVFKPTPKEKVQFDLKTANRQQTEMYMVYQIYQYILMIYVDTYQPLTLKGVKFLTGWPISSPPWTSGDVGHQSQMLDLTNCVSACL